MYVHGHKKLETLTKYQTDSVVYKLCNNGGIRGDHRINILIQKRLIDAGGHIICKIRLPKK